MDDPKERCAYLDVACNGDAQLRAEVESLIGAYGNAEGFMSTQDGRLFDDNLIEAEGDQVEGYRLLKQIGEGGFGVVYLAGQTKPVQREVALKVIKAGMDSREVVARFEAERQTLALMDHPNIAKVYDAGTTEMGRPFFVMELVKGIPLSDYCSRKALSVNKRLRLFIDVCAAVQHAHQKGVIHRDLKPSNILVSEHDGNPVVKVIDFGIAKAIGMELTERTVFTQLGRMLGTPQYMSPEQADLKALDVDTRSDIYSLGVVLYELLTGTTPLDGKKLRSAAYDEIQQMIRVEVPPKPSTRATSGSQTGPSQPGGRRHELKKDLDWVVMKALDKDRERRFETVGALAKDLERYLSNEPVSAGPPSAIYRLGKFTKRNRRVLITSAVAALALLIGLSVAGGLWLRESQRVTRVEETAETLLIEAGELMTQYDLTGDYQDSRNFDRAGNLARRAVALLESTNREHPGLEERSSHLLARIEAKERGRDFIFSIEEAEIKAISVGRMIRESSSEKERRIDEAFENLGLHPLKSPIGEAAEAIRKMKGSLREFALVGLRSWAEVLRKSDPGQTLQLEEIIDLADQDSWRRQLRAAIKNQDTSALEALANSPELAGQPSQVVIRMASAFAEGQLAGPMERIMRRTQAENPTKFWPNFMLGQMLVSKGAREGNDDLRDRLIPTAPIDFLAEAEKAQGHTLEDPLQWEEAIGFFRAAVAARPAFAPPRLYLGIVLSTAGHPEESLTTLRDGASLHPETVLFDDLIAWTLLASGRREEAVPYLKRATSGDDGHILNYHNLGMALLGLGHYDDGRKALMKASQLYSQGAGESQAEITSIGFMGVPSDFDEDFISLTVASTQALQGRHAEALFACREFLQDGREDTRALYLRGYCLMLMKESKAAEESLKKGIDQGPKTREILKLLGISIMMQKRWAEARSALEEALAMEQDAFNKNPREVEEAEILANLGGCLLKLNQMERARSMLEKAAKLDPGSPLAWHNLGSCFLEAKNKTEAIKCFEKAIEIDPDYSLSNKLLATLYWEAGKVEESIAAAKRLNEAETFQLLGVSLLKEKKFDQAIDAFKRAIALKPNLVDSHHGLGGALFQLNRFAEAIGSFQKAIELRPGFQQSHEFLAIAHKMEGNHEEALNSMLNALQIQVNGPLVGSPLIIYLHASGRLQLAELVHGNCGDHHCPIAVAAAAERELLALLEEESKVTPGFLKILKQTSSDLIPHFKRSKTIPPPRIEDLELIWKNERTKVLERLGSVTLRQIYLKRSPESLDSNKVLANDLLKQLKSGADFTELGERYSEWKPTLEPKTVNNGELAATLNDAAFSLTAGELFPEVIEMPNGFFLLRVDSRDPGKADHFDDEGVERAARAVFFSEEGERWQQRILKRLTNPAPDLIAAKVRNLVAESLLAQGERERAQQLFDEALKTFEFEAYMNDPIKIRVEENLERFRQDPEIGGVDAAPDDEQAILKPDEAKSINAALKEVKELQNRDLSVQDDKLIKALLELGIAHRNAGQFDQAITVVEKAGEIATKQYSKGHHVVAICLYHRAQTLRIHGGYDEAVKQFDAILKMNTAKGSFLAEVHNGLGLSHGKRGDLKLEETHLRTALELRLGIWGENHQELIQTETNLGWNLLNRGDFAGARKLLEKVIKVERTPEALQALSLVHGKFAEFEKAEKLLREAIGIWELRKDHFSRMMLAYVWSDFAGNLGKRGFNDDAEKYYKKALKLHEEAMGPGHSGEAIIRSNLGLVLNGREAVGMQKKALELIQKSLGPDRDHHDLVVCLNNLALAHASMGELQQAKERAKESLSMARRIFSDGKPHQLLALPMLVLAQVQRDLKLFSEAQKSARSGVAMLRKLFPEGHPEILTAIQIEAFILAESGRYADAVPFLREILHHWLTSHPDHPDLVAVHSALASCLMGTEDFKSAEIELWKVVKLLEMDPNSKKVSLAVALTDLALTLEKLKKLPEAEEACQRGIEVWRKQKQREEELAAALIRFSSILRGNDKPNDALKAAREALSLRIDYLKNSPDQAGYAHKMVAAALVDLGMHSEAVVELEKALGLVTQSEARMFLLSDLSDSFVELGKMDSAEEARAQIEKLAEELEAPKDLPMIPSLEELGFRHINEENWSTAETLIRAAIRLKRAGDPKPDLVMDQISLGRVLLERQKFTEAGDVYQKALRYLKRNAVAKPSPSFVGAHFGLGQVLYCQGRYEQAEKEVIEATRVMTSLAGPNHPHLMNLDCMRAVIKYESGDYQLAVAGFRKVLEKLEPGNLQLKMRAKNGLAKSLRSLGKLMEAKVEIDGAITIQGELDADFPGSCQRTLAMILRDQERFTEADQIFNELMAELDEELQAEDLGRVWVRVEFATSLLRQKHFQRALGLAEVALKVQRNVLRAGHPKLKKTLELLSEIHSGLGNAEKAAAFGREAEKIE